MRSTGFVVLISAVLCGALWLVALGLTQPRPTLERSIRHLRRPPIPPQSHATQTATGRRLLDRLGTSVSTSGVERYVTRWTQPLRLVSRSTTTHVGILAAVSIAGFVVPSLLLAMLHLVGVISIVWFVPSGLSVMAAVLAPLVVHADTISRATAVRVDLRHQLSAFLDMVTMLLAGNTGYEGALDQAARAGDGMLFRELRRRMREVATTGRSLVGALSLVGDDYGVVELEQVAAAATLSAAEGAPVARTLAAKCSTLRSTLAAEQEASARVRNDKVTPPLVGMALLFMALIIYPALNLS